jgi:hypothetical protein
MVPLWWVRRLRLGRAQYGLLRVTTDRRSFIEEALHEATDLAVYLAAERLRASG